MTHPLSSQCFIEIDFPLEIGLNNFIENTSICEVTLPGINVDPWCTISDLVNKIMRVYIDGTSAIPAGQITIRLGDIINPDNP